MMHWDKPQPWTIAASQPRHKPASFPPLGSQLKNPEVVLQLKDIPDQCWEFVPEAVYNFLFSSLQWSASLQRPAAWKALVNVSAAQKDLRMLTMTSSPMTINCLSPVRTGSTSTWHWNSLPSSAIILNFKSSKAEEPAWQALFNIHTVLGSVSRQRRASGGFFSLLGPLFLWGWRFLCTCRRRCDLHVWSCRYFKKHPLIFTLRKKMFD